MDYFPSFELKKKGKSVLMGGLSDHNWVELPVTVANKLLSVIIIDNQSILMY